MVAQMEAYKAALYEVNKTKNLTRVSEEDFEERHLLDSLIGLQLIPEGSEVVDLGTGPGLPGWPLACARPDIHVTAVDGSVKMFGPMGAVPLPNLTLLHSRAEDIEIREAADAVTGRAIAPLAIQLELSAPLLKEGGILMPYRTVQERQDVIDFPAAQLGLELAEIFEEELPTSGAVRMIPVYRKVSATPKEFPRPWARMKKRPLRKPDAPGFYRPDA
jgi:16S rRNA (guanine527-N7)-methyltransferase